MACWCSTADWPANASFITEKKHWPSITTHSPPKEP